MGTDKGERKTNSKKKGFLNGSNLDTTSTSWDWGTVEPGDIYRLVELVTSRGGAIRFGYSRDGNAGSIGVYYGEDRDTVYIRPSEGFDAATKPIVDTFEALPYTGGKQPKPNG